MRCIKTGDCNFKNCLAVKGEYKLVEKLSLYCTDYTNGIEQVCERNTDFREDVFILVMVDHGGLLIRHRYFHKTRHDHVRGRGRVLRGWDVSPWGK